MAHRRPPKGEDHYRRGSAKRRPRRRVLIVAEGRTELAYLRELLDRLGLNRANVEMRQGQPPNPGGVLRAARLHVEADPDEYSRVFCVFDRDEHRSFAPALREIQTGIQRGEIIAAVPSAPCFEYWLLLHFENTTRPYPMLEDESSCGKVERDLRGHMREYRKGMKGARRWRRITSRLMDARKNSRETLRQAELEPGENYPYTRMHELVDYLERMNDDD